MPETQRHFMLDKDNSVTIFGTALNSVQSWTTSQSGASVPLTGDGYQHQQGNAKRDIVGSMTITSTDTSLTDNFSVGQTGTVVLYGIRTAEGGASAGEAIARTYSSCQVDSINDGANHNPPSNFSITLIVHADLDGNFYTTS